MTNTTTVDAIKTESAGQQMLHVPITLDAKPLMEALQAAENQQQSTRVNPSVVIKDSATRMAELYARFNALRQLGAELHGKTLSDPIPDTIKIEDVAITFRSVKDGKQTEPVVANIKNVVCVGDIAPLMSTELGTIILALTQEAAAIKETAELTAAACTKARQQWEASNPDRKVVTSSGNLDTNTVAPYEDSLRSSAPITLRAGDETSTI